MAVATCLDFSVLFRLRIAAAIDSVGAAGGYAMHSLLQQPQRLPVLTSFTLYAYGLGGWHWKFVTLVSGYETSEHPDTS